MPANATLTRSRRARWLRWGAGAALGAMLYVTAGNLLHRVVFPLPPPDPTTFPRAGDVFESRMEGFHQRVVSVEDGWIRGELTIVPGAVGPPAHYHVGFAETFTVEKGVLYLELVDELITLRAGESYRVQAGIVHRPYNPGTEAVVVAGGLSVPLEFAACLVQLYSFMEEFGNGPTVLLELSLAGERCDTHLGSVPAWVEKTLHVLLAPAARLTGHRGYYPERSLHPPRQSSPVASSK